MGGDLTVSYSAMSSLFPIPVGTIEIISDVAML